MTKPEQSVAKWPLRKKINLEGCSKVIRVSGRNVQNCALDWCSGRVGIRCIQKRDSVLKPILQRIVQKTCMPMLSCFNACRSSLARWISARLPLLKTLANSTQTVNQTEQNKGALILCSYCFAGMQSSTWWSRFRTITWWTENPYRLCTCWWEYWITLFWVVARYCQN